MSNEFTNLLQVVKNNRKYSVWVRKKSIDEYSEHLVDEIKEVIEAIKNNDIENLKEELGNTLWDILTMLAICEEEYGFGIDDSARIVLDKFKKRKPHIFEGKELTIEEEFKLWNDAKNKEKTKLSELSERKLLTK